MGGIPVVEITSPLIYSGLFSSLLKFPWLCRPETWIFAYSQRQVISNQGGTLGRNNMYNHANVSAEGTIVNITFFQSVYVLLNYYDL